MNVVIVSAVFPPEPVVTAQTSFQIADELFHDGHQVTVLAPFPNRPDGRLFKGYRRSLYRRESMGFSVIRCFSFLSRKSTMGSRLLENMGFAITCSARVLFLPRPDVLYMNSWVIVCSGMVSAAAWLRSIPVAMSIQDVYPESLSQQKRISAHSLLFRVLRALDRRIAHSAKALIVISDQFRETYRVDRGVPAERIHVLQNWGETSSVNVDARGAYGLRQKYGILDHTTLAVYAGNIGAAAGVETAIKAFEYLWNDENICMLIAGVGSSLASVSADGRRERAAGSHFFLHALAEEGHGNRLRRSGRSLVANAGRAVAGFGSVQAHLVHVVRPAGARYGARQL